MHLTQIKFVLQGTAHAELKIKILAQKQKVDFEIHYDQSLIGTACLAKIIEDIYIYIYIYILLEDLILNTSIRFSPIKDNEKW